MSETQTSRCCFLILRIDLSINFVVLKCFVPSLDMEMIALSTVIMTWSNITWYGIRYWKLIHLDDVMKWRHFPRYWPFVWGIHRSPVNSPHKGQWRGVWVFSLICGWTKCWVNNREAGDLRRHLVHCDVIVMCWRHYDIIQYNLLLDTVMRWLVKNEDQLSNYPYLTLTGDLWSVFWEEKIWENFHVLNSTAEYNSIKHNTF